VLGAPEDQLRQMPAAASTLAQNPVSTSRARNKQPNVDDSSDDEELSFLYVNPPAAVVVPPVIVAPSPATVLPTTVNAAIAAGLLPPAPLPGVHALLPPVPAIVGNGQQANNRGLNAAIGLAAGGGGRKNKRKTISQTDAASLTRGRVDHIDSLDCINRHINSSVGMLTEAFNARRNNPPPPLTSVDVNAQLFTLEQRRQLINQSGMDTTQINSQIDRLNTVYNNLIAKEMGDLLSDETG
jgi:hypothetical protein